ncbi:unnamed protein product [Sympodiomycopsis kandeliae]
MTPVTPPPRRIVPARPSLSRFSDLRVGLTSALGSCDSQVQCSSPVSHSPTPSDTAAKFNATDDGWSEGSTDSRKPSSISSSWSGDSTAFFISADSSPNGVEAEFDFLHGLDTSAIPSIDNRAATLPSTQLKASGFGHAKFLTDFEVRTPKHRATEPPRLDTPLNAHPDKSNLLKQYVALPLPPPRLHSQPSHPSSLIEEYQKLHLDSCKHTTTERPSVAWTPTCYFAPPAASVIPNSVVPVNAFATHDPAKPVKKENLYKTELCRGHEEKGFCDYGAKCQYAHGAHELRSITRHPKWKTVLCRTYWRYGSCPYAKRCCFIHEFGEWGSSNTGANNAEPTQQPSLLTRVRAMSDNNNANNTENGATSPGINVTSLARSAPTFYPRGSSLA